MKELLISLLIFFLSTAFCFAQIDRAVPRYGTIDTADLRMADCAFQPGANAMALFDYAEGKAGADSITMTMHKRIKIFNAKGSKEASIRLPYYSGEGFERIYALKAQTINLENNQIVITPLDAKLIYTEVTNKNNKALVFSFPNVKPGCIIEYSYRWITKSPFNLPVWSFQSNIPTHWSELDMEISKDVVYRTVRKGYQAFVKDTSFVSPEGSVFFWAKKDVPSFYDEPYTTVRGANIPCLLFQLNGLNSGAGLRPVGSNSWMSIAGRMMNDEDFGDQLKVSLSNEDILLKKAKTLATDDERIAYLFGEVKKTMKWNGVDQWYTDKGVRKAWDKQTGNSTEINLILYHLLQRAKIDVKLLAVGDRNSDGINKYYASFRLIDKVDVYTRVDSTHHYVLDASNKYNVYNETPADILNTEGLLIFRDGGFIVTEIIPLKNEIPAAQLINVEAEISLDGKASGTAAITSTSYAKAIYQDKHEHLAGEKYTDVLRADDNNLKITDLKLENMDVDSLPLIQKFSFVRKLPGTDDKYMYINPSMLSTLPPNPFVSEKRNSDIDFGSCVAYYINGKYKLPPGCKVDALPANIQVETTDKSVVFKRILAQTEDTVEIRYKIVFTRSKFLQPEYAALHDFYKKMYELINEPIVLKKS